MKKRNESLSENSSLNDKKSNIAQLIINLNSNKSSKESKKEMLAKWAEETEREKDLYKEERIRVENREMDEAAQMVIMPKYKLDARLKVEKETNPPPPELFMPLGWDENKDSKRKHYRQFYRDELENIREIFPKESPFNKFYLKRG